MNSLVGQRVWKGKLVAGLLTVVLGAIVLAWPGPTILVASTLFGVYLLVSGLAELFMAFTLPRSAATRVMLFISGALSLVLAILSFRHVGDGYAALLLSLWIGIGFVFQGVTAVAVGIGESDLPGRGWYVVAGIVSVIAGLVMLVWPFDSIAVLTLAAGILARRHRHHPNHPSLPNPQSRQHHTPHHRRNSTTCDHAVEHLR